MTNRALLRWARVGSLAVLCGMPVAGQADAPFEFLLAGSLLADGQSGEAVAAFEAVLRDAPTDPYVRLEYAQMLSRLGRFQEAATQAAAARELAPEDADVLRTQARIALARAEREPAAREVAREAFERLLLQEPDDLETLISLGQLYLAGGDAPRAAEVLGRASILRPGQAMIDALYARALAASGDLGGAERVQRALLADSPYRLDTRFELAATLAESGRHREAAELLGEAPPEQAVSPELRRRRAFELYLAGDLEAAGVEARALQAESPDHPGMRVLLATLEQAEGNWQSVLDLVGVAAERVPTQDALHALRLRALERLGRVDDALAAAEQRRAAFERLGRGREEAEARLDAGSLALRSGRPALAAELARPLLAATDPEIALAARLLVADAATDLADYAAALEVLANLSEPLAVLTKRYEILLRSGSAEAKELGERLAGGSPAEALAAAEALQRLERYAEARPLLERVVAAEPSSLVARFWLGATLERLGEADAAEGEFRRLLAAAPDHAPTLNYLGYMWIESGKNVDEAVGLVERAVRLDPDNGAYVDSLGWGYFRQGRLPAAVRMLERAVRLQPEDATVLEHLGDAYLANGDPSRARSAYQKALELGGETSPELPAKLARLTGTS